MEKYNCKMPWWRSFKTEKGFRVSINLGTYDTIEEAKLIRDKALNSLLGIRRTS